MAKKEVGFVELEWVCPTCNSRNPGPQKTCTNCGAAQPENVQFQAPVQADLLQDETVAAKVQAGPDVHCPYCDARNPGDAKVCVQCGAGLEGAERREAGAVVGAYQAGPAPQIRCAACGADNVASAKSCARCGTPLGKTPTLQPAPAPAKTGGCAWWWIAAAVIVLFVIVGAFAYFSSQTDRISATAEQARWVRTIEVLGLTPVHQQAWRDELPADADVQSCQQALRFTTDEPEPGAVEVCGTPYTEDTGTGYGRVVQDCQYQVYDEMCAYTTLQWRPVEPLRLEGVGLSPQWPVFSQRADRREGNRSERLTCTVSVDGQSYTFPVTSFEEYERCQPGSQWTIEVNTFGSVISAEPNN
jgi:ribosomal protein L40E